MDIHNLSLDEMLSIIEEQKKKIEYLEAETGQIRTSPPSDWHSWIDIVLHMFLHGYKSVKIHSELKLGVQPPRTDFVVVNEDQHVDLELEIFDIFREHNIIEFKSPGDELSIYTICKGIGYVGFYIYVMHRKGIDVDLNQVTLTFVRDTRPDKLLRELADHIEEGPVKGIYYIKNWEIKYPIQIIHSAALKGEKYAGLRVISNDPSVEDIGEMFKQSSNESDPVIRELFNAYWKISAKLTGEKLEEAKRRYPEMAKTIFDIFKPEIDEKINMAVDSSTRNNLFRYVYDGAMTADYAAKEAGMNTVDFIASMKQAGYNVPETA